MSPLQHVNVVSKITAHGPFNSEYLNIPGLSSVDGTTARVTKRDVGLGQVRNIPVDRNNRLTKGRGRVRNPGESGWVMSEKIRGGRRVGWGEKSRPEGRVGSE